jgi:hypothetical protein
MFVRVSVPPAGVGAVGTVGDKGRTVPTLVGALAVDFWTAGFWLESGSAKLSIASEMPAVHNSTPTKLRALIKADLEEDFFFI